MENFNGSDSINRALERIEQFIIDDEHKVFLFIGRPDIGKSTAVNNLLINKNINIEIEKEIFQLTNLDKPKERILSGQAKVYVWQDFDYSDLVFPEVKNIVKMIESKKLMITGKLLLIIDEDEVNPSFSKSFGVIVHMNSKEMLDYIKKTIIG